MVAKSAVWASTDVREPVVVPVALDEDGREVVVPLPLGDGGTRATVYPVNWKAGRTVKVQSDPDGPLEEFLLVGFRAMTRWRDETGQLRQVKVVRAGEAARSDARKDCVAKAEQARDARKARLRAEADAVREAALREQDGDTVTTVGALVRGIVGSPWWSRKSARTRLDYKYVLDALAGTENVAPHAHRPPTLDEAASTDAAGSRVRRCDPTDEGAVVVAHLLPRAVTLTVASDTLESWTRARGARSAVKARALLTEAFKVAGKRPDLQVPLNVFSQVGDAIQHGTTVRPKSNLRKRDTLSVEQVRELLAALRDDPLAALPSGTGVTTAKGGRPVKGADLADLVAFEYSTGCRIGEVCAVRWSDLRLTVGQGSVKISGTISYEIGNGTWRQPQTKTDKSRTVTLDSAITSLLRRRAEVFGIDPDGSLPDLPLFPTPTDPALVAADQEVLRDAWRDQANLHNRMRKALDRHGFTWASSHTARRFSVTSAVNRGVPLAAVAKRHGMSVPTLVAHYLSDMADDDANIRADLDGAALV